MINNITGMLQHRTDLNRLTTLSLKKKKKTTRGGEGGKVGKGRSRMWLQGMQVQRRVD